MIPKLPSRQSNSTKEDIASAGQAVVTIRNNQLMLSQQGHADLPLLQQGALSVTISHETKLHLAVKISRLLPDLMDKDKGELLHYVIDVLEALCNDQLLRIREILSQELKDMLEAPHHIIVQLARDTSASVSCPIIECSPVLNDQDLVEIIKHYGKTEVLMAVAGRKRLSHMVSDALVACRNSAVMQKLLGRRDISLSAKSLQIMADEAEADEDLHEPLLRLPDLPRRILNQMAMFVSRSLLDKLSGEGVIPNELMQKIEEKLSRRIISPTADHAANIHAEIREKIQQKSLNYEDIEEILLANNRAAARAILIELSGFSAVAVDKILQSANANAVTALCWKCGLTMRHAMQVQQRMANIPYANMLRAKNGRDFPLSIDAMETFLDMVADK